MSTPAPAIRHNISKSLFATSAAALLGALESLTGDEVDNLRASLKTAVADLEAAAPHIAVQVFNRGIEAVPGLNVLAGPIELVGDLVVSGVVSDIVPGPRSGVASGVVSGTVSGVASAAERHLMK